MSLRRLLMTAAAMAGVGLLLGAAVPDPAEVALAFTHPQRLADTAGPDAVVVCLASTLAALAWAWGALGLVLTAAGALPGVAGLAGRLLVRAVLPNGARRAAAVVLGVGIGLNGPLLTGIATAAPAAAPAVTTVEPEVVPDWPVAPDAPATTPVPDWPTPRPAGTHAVRRGECLWTIAATHLRSTAGDTAAHAPTDAAIAAAVQRWWRANADVIGPDPDLLLPGQVLRAPTPP